MRSKVNERTLGSRIVLHTFHSDLCVYIFSCSFSSMIKSHRRYWKSVSHRFWSWGKASGRVLNGPPLTFKTPKNPLLLWFSLTLAHWLPLFNLDCLWRLLEQAPAAGAGSWLESGTFTRWWLMETNVKWRKRRRGGRTQSPAPISVSAPSRSLPRLCQKSHRLREALINAENRYKLSGFQTLTRPWMHHESKNDQICGCQNTGQLKKLIN